MTADPRARTARAERVLAGPVVAAASASVPATFLTLQDGTAGHVGQAVNAAAAGVLVAETAVLLWLADDKARWLRERWWLVAVSAAVVSAVVFALGPAHLLRLVRAVGALRVLRVRRILRAGKVVSARFGDRLGARTAAGATAAAAAAFVAVALSDPTSASRRAAEGFFGTAGAAAAAAAAGAVLAAATFVVARARRRGRSRAEPGPEPPAP